MWAKRVLYWRSQPGMDYLLLFKNEGLAAGASLEHIHSQFTALAKTPDEIAAMWTRLAKEPTQSLSNEELTIKTQNRLTLFSPLAPRAAFETWIASTDPRMPFTELAADTAPSIDHAGELAMMIQAILRETTNAARASGANLVLQVAPNSMVNQVPRWWIEVAPRSSAMAGFELATNLRINAVSPQQAVERLKSSF